MSCLVEQVAGCSFTIMKTFSEWLISLEDERLEIGDWRMGLLATWRIYGTATYPLVLTVDAWPNKR